MITLIRYDVHFIACESQLITAYIDSRLLDSLPQSGLILTQLEASGVKHKIEMSPVARSVYWKRERVEHYLADNNQVKIYVFFQLENDILKSKVKMFGLFILFQVCSRSNFVEEDECLVVIPAGEFNSLAQVSLCNFYDSALRSLEKSSVTLIVFGLNQLLRYSTEQINVERV